MKNQSTCPYLIVNVVATYTEAMHNSIQFLTDVIVLYWHGVPQLGVSQAKLLLFIS